MGDAKDRGTREARVAAALAREDARRAAWAEEMVADAAALLEAAERRVRAGYGDAVGKDDGPTEDDVHREACVLASIASQRAVAQDLVDGLPEIEDEDDEEPLPLPVQSRPKSGVGFSLVTPKTPGATSE